MTGTNKDGGIKYRVKETSCHTAIHKSSSICMNEPPAHSYRASHTDNRRGMLLGFTRVYAALLCHVLAASPRSREGRRERGISHKRWKSHPTKYFGVKARASSRQTTSRHVAWCWEARALPKRYARESMDKCIINFGFTHG